MLAQRLVALGCAILQRRACLGGQHLIDGRPDSGHVEHRTVGKTARKTDDAGLAQQLEQLANRRCLDVV
ncbi:hypothetical protein SDC9_197164 [bioreactor metagenome]|uniref:Uncharacterized protein n=1 Tax=bioreactor metagenome TaxID=1076179 RepID=A0A645IQK1_9ZZZZ